MKIILDTNIYISAFAFDKLILNLTSDLLEKKQVYLSKEVFQEIQNKFLNGRLAKIHPKFNLSLAKEFLVMIEEKTYGITVTEKVGISRDSKDNMILELAKQINADYIITGDKNLLVLKTFQKTEIMGPLEFIQKVKD
jgi:uncharacterized protein